MTNLENDNKLFAGGATKSINCDLGDSLAGQLFVRKCKTIRDNLQANAFYLSNGKESFLFISCDLLLLDREFYLEVTPMIEKKLKIPSKNILIGCTHTHTGPDTFELLPGVRRNVKYLNNLKNWLVELSIEAVKSAKPAKIGWAAGNAHVGYNRRTCWQDSSHKMYGNPQAPGFTGLEGPDDDRHSVLFAADKNDKIIAVVHNNACHSTCMEIGEFASADFSGEARKIIRDRLGKNIPVLYLQGASGDISPWNLMQPNQTVTAFKPEEAENNREARLKEAGKLLADETLRLIKKSKTTTTPVLKSIHENIKLAVRLPTAKEAREMQITLKLGEKKIGTWEYVLKSSRMKLYNEYKNNPVETITINVFRIGDVSIATNPCELYCQFGLDIKRRSPAKATMVSQLSNGFSGYCPTIYGIMGGGYSGEAIYWCRLEPYAGYKIVDTTAKLLNKLWGK